MSHNKYYGTGIPSLNALDMIEQWNQARQKGYKSIPSARQLWWLIAFTALNERLMRAIYFNVTKKRYGSFVDNPNARNAIFHGVARKLGDDQMENFVTTTLTRILRRAQKPAKVA